MSGSCAPTAVPATNEETAEPPSGYLQIAATSPATRRKCRPAGTPDPDAEVVSLSPRTLLEPKTYVCEICNRGFRRATNLQMHRRRHGVPWEQLQRRDAGKAAPPGRKRVFVCPEPSCPHHHPSRALSGASAIKHHFRRQHGAHRQWSCSRCSRAFAVHGDYKAHLKTCGGSGTRARLLRYPCHCGRVFFRVDTFAYHQRTCRGVPPQAGVLSAPVCGALSAPQQRATSPYPSGFAMPSSSVLIGAVIWPGATAMRSPTVATFNGFLPPTGTSRSGHDLELQLMPPSCHAAPRSPPAPISWGDDGATQLQLSTGLCSGDNRAGEEFRPSSFQAPRGRARWRRAVHLQGGAGGAAAGDGGEGGSETTCSPSSPTPSSSTAYGGGVTSLQWAMRSLPSWTAS
ncbi:zinc finger protein SHOOT GRAVITROPISM 5-like [Triticum dicoccoides]|uniref:zinc finger protein SHOOT GRAVITROPISM 5-like n=1 Tax=Triticum dicoccoides TaxID=85692 RepID=UPI0018911B4C|nr:zinc finger protein SHOOT GRAVITROPISM 5-like [Triticum dicoccoides]